MIKFGSRTPKPSLLWSNSKNVGVFRTGTLRRQRLKRKQPQLVKHYRDGSGQKRFSGIRKNLKKSGFHGFKRCFPFGHYLYFYGLGLCFFFLAIHSCLPRAYPLGFALKYLKHFEDLKKKTCRLRQLPVQAWHIGFYIYITYIDIHIVDMSYDDLFYKPHQIPSLMYMCLCNHPAVTSSCLLPART